MPLSDPELDEEIRASAMAWLRAELLKTPGGIPHSRLTEFRFRGTKIPLIVQGGIHKPKMLEAALSIKTTFSNAPDERPYDDEPGPDGLLRYKWRGTDPSFWDNRALRLAMEHHLPLIYLVGIAKGLYQPLFPVYLVAEESELHQFVVTTTAQEETAWDYAQQGGVDLSRKYLQTVSKYRVHQRIFREQVLLAYDSRCALCNLGHRELIDAAHIKEDSAGGEPTVTNGIAMCKLHHATFDNLLVGLSPDYRIHVRDDLLTEIDGPTLQHSIKQLHGQLIRLPSKRAARPNVDLLTERWERFQEAG